MDVEHILYALLAQEKGIVPEILHDLNIDVDCYEITGRSCTGTDAQSTQRFPANVPDTAHFYFI